MSGTKFDSEKEPLDLLPPEALFEIGRVLAAGKKKYGTANWAKGISISRLIAAALRHTFQFLMGEDYDKETKTLHIANACTNLMFAIWMLKNRPDLDDRWINDIEKPPKDHLKAVQLNKEAKAYLKKVKNDNKRIHKRLCKRSR